MAKRRRKPTARRSRKKKGVTFTDDQKLALLAVPGVDDETKKKILRA